MEICFAKTFNNPEMEFPSGKITQKNSKVDMIDDKRGQQKP